MNLKSRLRCCFPESEWFVDVCDESGRRNRGLMCGVSVETNVPRQEFGD
ncbi:hypothetical protein N9248_00120 [bacterium]|nr:hypothetical protein [bacterium]MDB4532691.1 hypothetical protein [bacterium]